MGRWISYQDQENAEKYVSCPGSRNSTSGPPPCGPAVVLNVDEYEAIRLIDRQGFSQEECSAYMQVARTTVQMIYNSARKKLAAALVDGLPLRIEGGSYQLCDGKEEACGCGGCRRHLRACSQKTLMEEEVHEDRSPLDENKKDVCIVLARTPYFLFRENGNDAIVPNPAAQAQAEPGSRRPSSLWTARPMH